ncbi:MAG: thiamine phosphate synthase [Bacteroidetes bacterium]|nr:thiamine phosphate synthase [Bacteroidota bacterium]
MKVEISRLHYITQDVFGFTHAQLAEFACKGGTDWVQLRVKNKPYEEWLKIAQETKLVCLKYRAKLVINDNVQLAKEISADGVHLGKEDMHPKEARKILGNGFIIGGSTNNTENVRRQMADGCDYIGLGPFRNTTTKEKLNPILGLDGIIKIAEQFGNKIPIIAIGGIKLDDVASLMQTGIHGVAVSSGINLAEDKSAAAGKFVDALISIKKLPLVPLYKGETKQPSTSSI